jgi:hypothetical protein
MKIIAYGQTVRSPFGLRGRDENALTFAMGYALSQSPSFLQAVLRAAGLGGLSRNSLERADIHLQRRGHGKTGITDVEIVVDKLRHVIIEAKVGLAMPTPDQIAKYLERLQETSAKQKRLVVLTDQPTDAAKPLVSQLSSASKDLVTALQWCDVQDAAARVLHTKECGRAERPWLRNFVRFVEEDYQRASIYVSRRTTYHRSLRRQGPRQCKTGRGDHPGGPSAPPGTPVRCHDAPYKPGAESARPTPLKESGRPAGQRL